MKNSKKVEDEKVGESGTGEEVKGLELGLWAGIMSFEGIIGQTRGEPAINGMCEKGDSMNGGSEPWSGTTLCTRSGAAKSIIISNHISVRV
jgi:hypothetical protein